MNFTPDRDNVMRRYEFAVVTETDEDRRPPVSKGKRHSYSGPYYKPQIIIVETTGDCQPIEVGTWMKPGHVNASIRICGTMQEAINVSYAIADEEYDPEIDYRGGRKRERKRKRPR